MPSHLNTGAHTGCCMLEFQRRCALLHPSQSEALSLSGTEVKLSRADWDLLNLLMMTWLCTSVFNTAHHNQKLIHFLLRSGGAGLNETYWTFSWFAIAHLSLVWHMSVWAHVRRMAKELQPLGLMARCRLLAPPLTYRETFAVRNTHYSKYCLLVTLSDTASRYSTHCTPPYSTVTLM